MKTQSEKDLDLQKLIEDLKNQTKIKKDYVVPSNFFEMKNGRLSIVNHGGENEVLHNLLVGTGISVPSNSNTSEQRISLDLLDVCHQHISEKLGIPKRYYDKMLKNGNPHIKLLDQNVSHWFKNGGEVNYLVRTFIDPDKGEGIARALLSDRFLPIDNYDILLACLDAVRRAGIDHKLFEIKGEITEKRFYARFSVPSIEVQAPNLLKKYRSPSDPDNGSTGIVSGFVITNSEVGHGQFSISPRVVILKCKNGMTFTEDAFQKKHLGAELDEFSQIIWSDETRTKNRELIISQITDRIRQYTNPSYIGAKINKLERLAAKDLNHPHDAVQNVCSSLNLGDEAERDILDAFLKGADPSPFGVAQAITYYAHKEADADSRFDLEAQSVGIMENIEKFDKPFVRDKTMQLELPPFDQISN